MNFEDLTQWTPTLIAAFIAICVVWWLTHRNKAASGEESSQPQSASTSLQESARPPQVQYPHHHHRRRRHRYENRNPTLSQSGGLPPIRPTDEVPGPVAPSSTPPDAK